MPRSGSLGKNALLDRDLGPAERLDAVDPMEAAYASAGVERFAAWVQSNPNPHTVLLSSKIAGSAAGHTTQTDTWSQQPGKVAGAATNNAELAAHRL